MSSYNQGRLTFQMVSNTEGKLFLENYEYDRTGNLLQKDDSVLGTDQFNYDPLGQIIGHINPERQFKRYVNDPAGDRLTTKIVQESALGSEWERQGEFEGNQHRFDRVGNMVERKGVNETRFVWDANGRLIESIKDGKKTSYAYDPLGRRVSKETGGVVTRFYWDGDALLGDVTKDDKREWIYYPGSFEPLAMVRNEQLYLYSNDPNGCPTRLMEPDGKVVWAAKYEAWGKIAKLAVDEVDQPLRLQGQYFDGETGLSYNRFRYYEPGIGAFVSQDPLGLLAGENVYGFGPNAQTWVDPLGLCCKSTSKKAVVIGEGMGRVKTAAKDLQSQGINAKWYQTWKKNWPNGRKLTPEEFEASKLKNKRWIESKIKKEYDIYDIGPDGRLEPSPFYQVEQNAVKSNNYPTIKLGGY